MNIMKNMKLAMCVLSFLAAGSASAASIIMTDKDSLTQTELNAYEALVVFLEKEDISIFGSVVSDVDAIPVNVKNAVLNIFDNDGSLISSFNGDVDIVGTVCTNDSCDSGPSILDGVVTINLDLADYLLTAEVGDLTPGALVISALEARIVDDVLLYNLNVNACITVNKSCKSVAVPEPSALTIFALGILGLASRRFNKKA